MRQNTPRRLPGKPAANPAGAGEHPDLGHLDLGMTVTVYCAESARRQLAATAAAEGTSGFAPADTGTGFTEH
jgi:hypothetical protein